VTYYGDNHPRYNGNVVKAMASAKHGYRTWSRCSTITSRRSISPSNHSARTAWQSLVTKLDDELLARVEKVVRPDADDCRSHRARARGGAGISIPASSIAFRTSSASARTCASTITSRRC
jgi:hypothetical protein